MRKTSVTQAVLKGHHPLMPDQIGTPQQWRWLKGIVYAVLALNLLDAGFTILWISLGLAREANPLLRHLIAESPLLFVATKVLLVALGSWLLWRHRRRPLATVAIFLAFLAYYWILIYHIGFLSALSGHRLFS